MVVCFCCAGVVSIMPFIVVMGINLGVPIAVQGLVGSIMMVVTFVVKPLVSMLADTFPDWRKTIFLGLITLCGLSLGCIVLIPPFGVKPNFGSAAVVPKNQTLGNPFDFSYLNSGSNLSMAESLLWVPGNGEEF